MTQAISTTAFINSLGVNTHLDFGAYGYQNLGTVENAIRYLGLSNLRDSAALGSDVSLWTQVAQATGVKFDAFIGETSPSGMQSQLALIPQLAQSGILNLVEGGNEEDDAYPASLGNTLGITAQFQQQVWATGQQFGLPVINMSFGAGWTAANNWQGDYDKVGNLSAYTTYANAHTYPGAGQTPDFTIQTLNSDAKLAASARQVITTEVGWDENMGFNQTQVANYVLDAALDGIKDGDAMMYYYGLFDDSAGAFGLMNQDGSAKPAGAALHNLTTLLNDSGGGSFAPGALNYTLNGGSGDNTLLMQKSDGSYWLSIWNESAGAHAVTLSLGSAATQIAVFDPLTGTGAVQTASNTSSITLTVPDHPVIVEIGGAAAPVATTPSTPTTNTPTPTPTATVSGPQDLALVLPGTQSVATGSTTAISGVSISDPWAATNSGSMALNVYDKTGTLHIAGKTIAPGSGPTPYGMFSGSLAQLNADLASLSYSAAAAGGTDSITVDVWNQAGVEATKSFTVTVGGTTPSPTPTPTATPTPTPTVTGPQDLALVLPGTQSVATGSTTAISGVSISDPWAATNSGSMALNVYDNTGTLHIAGQTFGPGGGPTAYGMFTGTLAQLNADLASLSYTAAAAGGTDSITVDVWNQAGVEATKSFAVTVGGAGSTGTPTATPAPTPTPTPPATQNTVTIAPSDYSPVLSVSNTQILASAGDHMIFINGTGDVLNASGGTETVQAYQGGNSLTTGAGNDTIRYSGSNNVINAGAGYNTLQDSGSNNTIVLPGANQGFDDVFGYMMSNGDQFDLRAALSGTQWNGDAASLGNFIHISLGSSNSSVISIDPTGSGGAGYAVARLEDSGPLSLTTLLAHSIT